jgi:hypothetical protein
LGLLGFPLPFVSGQEVPRSDQRANVRSYSEVQRSDFFSFFKVSEVARSSDSGGGAVIRLKPGGPTSRFIDIELKVDGSMIIQDARLLIDRRWVGTRKVLNPHARDVTKSFIYDLVATADAAQARLFVLAIMDLQGETDSLVWRRQEAQEAGPRPSDVRRAVQVYTGDSPRLVVQMSAADLAFANVDSEGRQRLRVSITRRADATRAPVGGGAAGRPSREALRRDSAAFWRRGGDLEQVLSDYEAASGEPAIAVVNRELVADAGAVSSKRMAVPAEIFLLYLPFALRFFPQAPVSVQVTGGNIGHAILAADISDGLDTLYYEETWRQGSFLAHGNNRAGTAAVPSSRPPTDWSPYKNPWMITIRDFRKVAYAYVVPFSFVESYERYSTLISGDLEVAIAEYRSRLHAAPDSARLILWRLERWAHVLFTMGQIKEALASLKMRRALIPTDTYAALNLAEAYLAAGDTTNGTREYEAVLTLAETDTATLPAHRRRAAGIAAGRLRAIRAKTR